MKPTVGRVVHFYSDEIDNSNKPGPYAATIAAVHSDTCVTLSVLLPWRHEIFVASSAQRKDVAGNIGSYWEWPPREPATAPDHPVGVAYGDRI